MTLLRHSLIKQRREQLRIDRAELARRIGISVHEYRDVEFYEHELTEVVPLKSARSLAAILGFELAVLFGAV
jgi:hypothetical protein